MSRHYLCPKYPQRQAPKRQNPSFTAESFIYHSVFTALSQNYRHLSREFHSNDYWFGLAVGGSVLRAVFVGGGRVVQRDRRLSIARNAADFAFEPTVRHWSEVLCTRFGRTASADGCRSRNTQAPPGGHSVLMTVYNRQL